MAKEESGRLFSKVAKFVRSPLKDWGELDAEGASAPENGYSRQALKDMIERRQRNDFVRRREFDMLRKQRKLQLRAGEGVRDGNATPSSLNVNSAGAVSDGRALTLKKIDEIEEQMSQQWWKGRGPNGELPGVPTTPTSMLATEIMDPPDDGASLLDGAPLPTSDGAVEEAAIRFAHSDDLGAEAILLQALVPDAPSPSQEEIWRTLLDLYRATDEPDKFSQAREQYVQHVTGELPVWRSLPAASLGLSQAGHDAQLPAPTASGADWTSPTRLSRTSLGELTAALSAAGPEWSLDWRPLEAIEFEAIGALRALFAHWAGMPVRLRCAGVDVLLAVLADATPLNERGVDDAWWKLRMVTLRLMNRPDDFELAALNYCITYEVSPPSWEDPQGQFDVLEVHQDVASGQPAPGHSASNHIPGPRSGDSDVSLTGALHGESLSTWRRLDEQLAGIEAPVISCASLVRMDFAAAGTLLNWVTARDGRGQRLQFVEVHRLIGAFFTVIGIADHASVVLRKD